VIVKADKNSEAGVLPDQKLLADMGRFNEELTKAGVMLAGEGLTESAKGVRVYFDGDARSVVDGPFTETKELVAGFWIWQCASLDEAVEWARRCPNPTGQQGQLEIRRIFEPDDFGDNLTPELRAAEADLRARTEG
jgi:hypothetical protein